jgi:sporulation protein YtfJ
MENNNLGSLMETTMQNIKNMVDVNTVVGEPIFTPDGITLIPVSRVTYGFGGGGAEFAQSKGYGGGTGCGVKVEPVGFLVVKDGGVRMLNVIPPANNTLDRIIDMVPGLVEKVDEMIDKIKDGKDQA